MACGFIARVGSRAIAARASAKSAKKINFRKELDAVAGANRTRLHEILSRVASEARAHEDIQHIMDMQLRLFRVNAGLPGQRPRQIRMAAM